jgi:hypothetical protein
MRIMRICDSRSIRIDTRIGRRGLGRAIIESYDLLGLRKWKG